MSSKLNSLKTSIWITRKARINASERLLSLEKFIQYINIYYSCFLCVLSVYGLTVSKDKIGLISAILSIILTIFIVYLNSQKFGERAQQLKINYIALQELYFILDNLDEENLENLEKYQNEYTKLLANCENHSTYDYYRILLNEKKIETISKLGIKYYIFRIFKWFCACSVILVPILLGFYSIN